MSFVLKILSASQISRSKGELWHRLKILVQSLLYVAIDAEYINKAKFDELYQQAEKTKALVGEFRHSLKKRI